MNKTKLAIAGLTCFTVLALCISCDKKVGKIMSTGAGATPPPAGFCDTITYTRHIKPIVDANCATSGCHVPGGGGNGDFTTYAGFKAKVDNGAVQNRAFSTTMPMPASGLLPADQLKVLKCWLDAGAPNN